MAYHVERHQGTALVEVRYSGIVSAAELREAVVAARSLVGPEPLVRVLADCSQLEGGHTVFDLLALAQELPQMLGSVECREAVVAPAGALAERDAQFWEAACSNRGLNTRAFHDRQSAERWLYA